MKVQLALRRFDELLDLQAGGKRASTNALISLEAALANSSKQVTSALEDAGILEHRAIVTGNKRDSDAYSEALVRLDAAYAELWAIEAIGRRLRIDDVSNERDRIVAETRDGYASPGPRSLESRMEFRRKIMGLVAPTEAVVQLWGIREIAPAAKDLAPGSEAALALRRRLSQVAKVSDGPTTVRVLKKKKA